MLPRTVIDASHSLLSLGVNDDWSFEEGVLARNPAMSITCVDGTAGMAMILRKTAQKFVDMLGYLLTLRINRMLRNADYLAKPFLFRRFFSRHELLPLMVAASDAPDAITLPTLIDRATGGRDDLWLIVKSDIEGAEFDVLPDSISRMRRVSALLVEFHRLDLHWERFEACMGALMRDFYIAHVHGNNFDEYIPGTEVPVTLEVTLVNKALVTGTPPPAQNSYPVPNLDMSNTRKRPDLRISFESA